MDLIDVYKPEFIKVNLEAEDKEEVFEELAEYFCNVSGNKERETILAALRERETKMSTGVRNGIAIPHGNTNAVDKLCGVLGISEKGIDYDALDGKPVHIFFLLLVPEHENERHLRALKRVAELLDQPNFYDDMLAQKTAKSAWDVLKKYEEIVTAA
jgi:PTS system fructose-specific IIC component/PTS system nitrogen regulatory IIA component